MYIFLDFNGTILNDVDLGLSIINKMLDNLNLNKIDLDKYKNIFTFPITKYYTDAGIDLNIHDFNELANFYIKEYSSRQDECNIFDNINQIVYYLKERGYKVIVFSATPIDLLTYQLKKFNIYDLFDDIIGIDDKYANVGKLEEGEKYIIKNKINPNNIIMIGDTLHDYEISKKLNVKCILVASGHQSYDVLTTSDAIVINNLNEIKDIL